MKKMTVFIVIFVGGLITGGCLVYHGIKRAPLYPPDYDHQPMNAWQGAVQLDDDADYAPKAGQPRPLPEKLQREEARQKPWEGRN